jgi:hypothetical protein
MTAISSTAMRASSAARVAKGSARCTAAARPRIGSSFKNPEALAVKREEEDEASFAVAARERGDCDPVALTALLISVDAVAFNIRSATLSLTDSGLFGRRCDGNHGAAAWLPSTLPRWCGIHRIVGPSFGASARKQSVHLQIRWKTRGPRRRYCISQPITSGWQRRQKRVEDSGCRAS